MADISEHTLGLDDNSQESNCCSGPWEELARRRHIRVDLYLGMTGLVAHYLLKPRILISSSLRSKIVQFQSASLPDLIPPIAD